MLQVTWVIEDKLAVSPMPSLSNIDVLAEIFDGVVVLIEPHEAFGNIELYLSKWRSLGVEVYYAPTPDFHPVDLLELHMISRWIDNLLKHNGRVLIHCMGGVGRSGLVASSYLLYRGWNPVEASQYIRELRPGALDNYGQARVFNDYYILLDTVDHDVLDKHLDYITGYVDKPMWRHLSKTLQLVIELYDHLGIRDLDLENTCYATLYHCFLDELDKLYRGNILGDKVYRILRKDCLEKLLIMIGHTLDYMRDSRLVITDFEEYGERSILILYCDYDCKPLIDRSRDYFEELSRTIGVTIDVIEQPYAF